MKFTCKVCDYNTENKSNYNRHMKSKIHIQKSNKDKSKLTQINTKLTQIDSCVNNEVIKFECFKCKKIFSSAPSLSRHKNKYCKGKLIDMEEVKIQLEKEFEDRLKHKELEIKNKYLEEQVKKLEAYINSGKAGPTYNVSIKKYIQQSYPDAPHLIKLDDYATFKEKEYDDDDDKDDDKIFASTLIMYYKEKKLHHFLGNFIIKNYKKEDPKDQSLWNSDVSRLTYIIKELLANKKSCWNQDFQGLKTKSYIVDPFLKYISEYCTAYIDMHKVLKTDINNTINNALSLNIISNITNQINNGELANDILKYISPYFKINKFDSIEHCNDSQEDDDIEFNEDISIDNKEMNNFIDIE